MLHLKRSWHLTLDLYLRNKPCKIREIHLWNVSHPNPRDLRDGVACKKRLAGCVCRFGCSRVEVGLGGLVVFCSAASSWSNSPQAAHPSFRQWANHPLANHYSNLLTNPPYLPPSQSGHPHLVLKVSEHLKGHPRECVCGWVGIKATFQKRRNQGKRLGSGPTCTRDQAAKSIADSYLSKATTFLLPIGWPFLSNLFAGFDITSNRYT